MHGKCPAVLDFKLPNGDEMIKHLLIEPLFFCKKCGMIKMINVWNNCTGLCEATLIPEKNLSDFANELNG